MAPIPPQYYMNYARSGGPAASVAYEQRPRSPETVQFGESSYSPYSALPNPNPSTSYSYQYPYLGFGGINGFFGSPPPYSQPPPPSAARAETSHEQKAPSPPPPPPPKESAWDFLNPFHSAAVDYYPAYTPSRDSKELREEEGIPDLEDEDHEVVKEVYGEEKKFVAVYGGGGGYLKVAGDEASRGIGGEVEYGIRSNAIGESSGVEYEVVDKNVIANETPRVESQVNVAHSKPRGPLAVSEAVSGIKGEFDRASDSGGEVSKILEVGKLPYCGKNSVYKGISKWIVFSLLP